MKKIVFNLSRYLITIMLWTTAAIFLVGSYFHITIQQCSFAVETSSPFLFRITRLKTQTPYGDFEFKNIHITKKNTLNIDELSYTPILEKTSLPTIHLEEIVFAIHPSVTVQAQLYGYPIRLTQATETSRSRWNIYLDTHHFTLEHTTDTLSIYGGSPTPCVSISTLHNASQGQLSLDCMSGHSGHIYFDAHHVSGSDIITPWGSVEKLLLKISPTHGLHAMASKIHTPWLNIDAFVFNKNSSTTTLLLDSNAGHVHAKRLADNTWWHSEDSQWQIRQNTSSLCATHTHGHTLCYLPQDVHYLTFQGPFVINSKAWKGMLAHIGLSGTYTGYLTREAQQDPLHIKLQDLQGELDHLAITFFMRIAYHIEHGTIELTGSSKGLTGHGHLSSPQGSLQLTTQIPDLSAVNLHLQGSHLTFTDQLNSLQGAVNLDLHLGALTQITGTIDIDSGKLFVKPMQHVELLHEDVHIYGETTPLRYALGLDIKVKNRIPIACMGILGQLGGWLKLKMDSQSEQRISGVLDVEQAVFRVYGREMTLDDVRIHWLNDPWDKATLDILAHRTVYSNISRPLHVNLSINGPWENPKVSLSSNQPQTNDIQILSYLFSRSHRINTSQDAAIVETLSAHPGQKELLNLLAMVDSIERGLGLDLLEISGINEKVDTTLPNQFVFGKLLHPKIMLKYKVSLDSAARNHITIDYNILPHLNLQIDTDQEDAGVYLLYEG